MTIESNTASENDNDLTSVDTADLMDQISTLCTAVRAIASDFCLLEEAVRPAWMSAALPSIRELVRVGSEIDRRDAQDWQARLASLDGGSDASAA